MSLFATKWENSNIVELMHPAGYIRPMETVLNQWVGSRVHAGVSGLADVI